MQASFSKILCGTTKNRSRGTLARAGGMVLAWLLSPWWHGWASGGMVLTSCLVPLLRGLRGLPVSRTRQATTGWEICVDLLHLQYAFDSRSSRGYTTAGFRECAGPNVHSEE